MLDPILETKINEVISILKSHKIVRAFAFGSVTGADFTQQSDIDFLVHFQPLLKPSERGALHLSLYDTLEKLLGRPVDVIPEDRIRNPFLRKSIEASKVLIYE
jgi:uncharacterized protein